MESLKIIGLSVLAGAVYGIVHDQVTARVCLEYFTVLHPDVFHTQSPTLLALGWGVLATWWVSLPLGLLLATAARAGSRPKVSAHELLPKLAWLLAIMAVCALSAGVAGYFFGSPQDAKVPPGCVADLWAHTMSYFSGFIGGIVLSILVWRSRGKMILQSPAAA